MFRLFAKKCVCITVNCLLAPNQVIDEEVRKGVPLDKIILGGFSMGGAMAMHAAFGDLELAAGIVIVSSFSCAREHNGMFPGALRSVVLGHCMLLLIARMMHAV